MPQLEFSLYLSQVFWFLISFGILYLGFSKIFMPKFKDITQERFNKTQKLQEEIQILHQKIDNIQDKVHQEEYNSIQTIEALYKKHAEEISNIKQEQALDFQNYSNNIKNNFEDELKKAKTKISEGINKAILDYSSNIIIKLTSKKPNIQILSQVLEKLTNNK